MGLLRKAVSVLASNMGLTDPRLVVAVGGGVESHSGERVTTESALQLDAVWACIRLVAQTIATLPIFVYERGEDGTNDLATGHSLYRILHDKPNAAMTAVEFWCAMYACKLLWGNAYAQIVRGYRDKVVALLPMRPDWTQVVRQPDGSMLYRYTWNGQTLDLPEEDVLHLKGFTLDGEIGLSAISAGRHSLGNAAAAEKTAGAIHKNGMRPSGVLTSPTYLTKEQRADAKVLMEGYRGAMATGRVPLLEGGWTFQSLSIPPEDAQLLETRSYNVETICRWFGVAPAMIGHTEKSTAWGTGLEQMNLWFLTYTLRPHIKETEQALAAKCFTAAERSEYFAEYNVDALLRTDSKARAENYRTLISTGVMTPNEARALENLPPVDGGDELFLQGAMMPLGALVAQAEQLVAAGAAGAAGGPSAPAGDSEEATDEEIAAVTDDEVKSLFSEDLRA